MCKRVSLIGVQFSELHHSWLLESLHIKQMPTGQRCTGTRQIVCSRAGCAFWQKAQDPHRGAWVQSGEWTLGLDASSTENDPNFPCKWTSCLNSEAKNPGVKCKTHNSICMSSNPDCNRSFVMLRLGLSCGCSSGLWRLFNVLQDIKGGRFDLHPFFSDPLLQVSSGFPCLACGTLLRAG